MGDDDVMGVPSVSVGRPVTVLAHADPTRQANTQVATTRRARVTRFTATTGALGHPGHDRGHVVSGGRPEVAIVALSLPLLDRLGAAMVFHLILVASIIETGVHVHRLALTLADHR